jgi:hypothetical protein
MIIVYSYIYTGARRRLLGTHTRTHAHTHRPAPKQHAHTPPTKLTRSSVKMLPASRHAPHRVQSLQEDAAEEGGEGGEEGGEAGGEGGNSTDMEEEAKPLTPREQLLAKFGCDVALKRMPGFWGEWFFVGQMPAPRNRMTEDGPTTDGRN